MFRRFLADRSGATAVEYALIVGVLSLVIVGGLKPVADALQALWGDNDNRLNQSWK
jgi:pilus assembly protein Flp/PilA